MKSKIATLMEELLDRAKSLGIEVRKEKLLREVGYRARSGRCRVKRRELIILDRDAPLNEQVDFLAQELSEGKPGSSSPLRALGRTPPSRPLAS